MQHPQVDYMRQKMKTQQSKATKQENDTINSEAM